MKRDYLLMAASGATASVLTLLLFMGWPALADEDPSTDTTAKFVPYKGSLERDGAPFTGDVHLTFNLYDGSAAVAPSWTETQLVPVSGGSFHLLLGSKSTTSVESLAAVLTGADDLQLEVVVNAPEGDAVLQGRQRFLPVPLALWSTASTNMVIEGDDNDGTLAALKVVSNGSAMHLDGTEIESLDGTLLLSKNSLAGTQFSGPENDGATAALAIEADTETLLIDGNEIDSLVGPLLLNSHSTQAVTVHGKFDAAYGMKLSGALDVDQGLDVAGANLKVDADVNVTGHLLVGYEMVECESGASCACPSKQTLSVGYRCATAGYLESLTKTLGGWEASCAGTAGSAIKVTYVLCARIGLPSL